MLDIRNMQAYGFDHAIRGMRNPLKSWDKSDSWFIYEECIEGEIYQQDYDLKEIGSENSAEYSPSTEYFPDSAYIDTEYPQLIKIGKDDLNLMQRLIRAGSDHRKFMRQLTIYCDIKAPLFWWKEYDTYKVGTTANSESTMHTLAMKNISIDDFTTDNILEIGLEIIKEHITKVNLIIDSWNKINDKVNSLRREIKISKQSSFSNKIDIDNLEKELRNNISIRETTFRTIIVLLLDSFMQSRTVLMNYEVLLNIYRGRKTHKLSEWRVDFVEKLVKKVPYANELIINV